MRFQCRIGTGAPVVMPIEVPVAPSIAEQVVTGPQPPAMTRPHPRLFVRGALAGAALLAAAGCATPDARVGSAWKVEPVFSIADAARSSSSYYTLGQYYDGTQEWDKAIAAYRKAVAADAGNVDAHGALGVALAQGGRYAEAETALRRAVALAPGRAALRNNLGYVLLLAGKAHEAVAELTAVVEHHGGNAIATANLRTALERSQDDRGAGNAVATLAASSAVPNATPAAASSAGPTAIADADVPAPPQPLVVQAEPAFRFGYTPTIAPLVQQRADTADTNTPDDHAQRLATPAVAAAVQAAVTAPAAPAALASRLEVSNGNGMPGMAARVGRWLAQRGMPATRLTNRPPFAQQQTVVQYRVGYEEAALRVARELPTAAKIEAVTMAGQRSDVRVLLGRDWTGPQPLAKV